MFQQSNSRAESTQSHGKIYTHFYVHVIFFSFIKDISNNDAKRFSGIIW